MFKSLKERQFWRETATFIVIMLWMIAVLSYPIALFAVLPGWVGFIGGGIIGWCAGSLAGAADRITNRFS
jgi:hypothetical protein